MKDFKVYRFTPIILLLLISYMGFSQDHIITLYVDTGQIEKPNSSQYCNFGQTDGSTNEDYTIYVENGDTIQWVGQSTSSNSDVVEITSINYHGGKNILGPNVIHGQDGVVNATVRNAQRGDEEKYIVKFKVYNNGIKRNGTFQIDPKVRVGGGG